MQTVLLEQQLLDEMRLARTPNYTGIDIERNMINIVVCITVAYVYGLYHIVVDRLDRVRALLGKWHTS